MANQQIDKIEDINEAINPITPQINGNEGLEILGYNRNQPVNLLRFSRSLFKIYQHLVKLYISTKNINDNKLDKGTYSGNAQNLKENIDSKEPKITRTDSPENDGQKVFTALGALNLKNWLVTNYTTLMNNIRGILETAIGTKLAHGGYGGTGQDLKNLADSKLSKTDERISISDKDVINAINTLLEGKTSGARLRSLVLEAITGNGQLLSVNGKDTSFLWNPTVGELQHLGDGELSFVRNATEGKRAFTKKIQFKNDNELEGPDKNLISVLNNMLLSKAKIFQKEIGNTSTITNLNSIIEDGFYVSKVGANKFSNLPSNLTNGAFTLEVKSVTQNVGVNQKIKDYLNNREWTRTGTNGNFTAWFEEWNAYNFLPNASLKEFAGKWAGPTRNSYVGFGSPTEGLFQIFNAYCEKSLDITKEGLLRFNLEPVMIDKILQTSSSVMDQQSIKFGSLIIKCGRNRNGTYTYTEPFPTACLSGIACYDWEGPNSSTVCSFVPKGNTQFHVGVNSSSAYGRWIAIGY